MSLRGRRRFFVVTAFGVLAVIVAVAVVVVATRWSELRLRYEVWRFMHTSAEAGEAAKALWDRGEPGRRVLRAVAFQAELAPMDTRTLALRQAALGFLYSSEMNDDLARDEPELIRYVLFARGLERDNALQALRRHSGKPGQALLDAAIETMLTDPNKEGSMQACLYLSYLGDRRALPALRRAAIESPHRSTRYYACCIGLCGDDTNGRVPHSMVDPANVPPLRRALADPEFSVRIAAGWTLSREYADPSGLAALVEGATHPNSNDALIREGVAAIRDRRYVAALVRASETATGPSAGAVRQGADEALGEITGTDFSHNWRGWLESHRSELPEQVEK
ncbi:MAG TPA: hypothetical protein VFF73_41970 [Planctomycetota bacterium]|nr:hypothetical protein [Planctomycetota bacterium]